MLEQLNPKYYRNVPPDLAESFLNFRKAYPYQKKEILGVNWRFLDTLQGEETLLVLAGATTAADVSFMSLEFFARTYRVIAPDYPPIGSLEAFFNGLLLLLEDLGIEKFYLLGGSYGGWMAQSLVRFAPARVKKLVITAVGPPNPENSRQLKNLLGWLRFLPTFVLKTFLNRSFANLDTDDTEKYPQMKLLWAMVKEVVNERLTRRDIFALFERLINQTEHYTFDPADLQDWPGKVLLVFGSEDPASPADKREAMQVLYPQAKVKVFEGGQHGIALTHQQEYFKVIADFLAGRTP